MRFRNRVIVITGAASGIGKACAFAFAQEGAHVIAVDINREGLDHLSSELAQFGRCEMVVGDIKDVSTSNNAVSVALEKFGTIDFLFNNAGIELIAPVLETDDADWDAIIDTNLRGSYLMAKACLRVMVQNRFGVIVNNASDAGTQCVKVTAAYSTSKAGIVQLTKSIAIDYAQYGIRSNCVCPGCIKTPLCERFNEEIGILKGKSGQEVLDDFVSTYIPMLRVGEPEEVASVVTFLCSDDARYVTGAVIPIDGGLTTGMGI